MGCTVITLIAVTVSIVAYLMHRENKELVLSISELGKLITKLDMAIKRKEKEE